jgi:hypothetical protein
MMDEVNLLESHYNSTYEVVKLVWEQRNRLTLYAYLLSLVLISTELQNILAGTMLDADPMNLPRAHLYILGLLALLGLLVLLTQRTLFLDKQYIYLDLIEKRIEYLVGYSLIAREGRYYRLEGLPKGIKKSTLPFHLIYDIVLILLTLFVLFRVLPNAFALSNLRDLQRIALIGVSAAIVLIWVLYYPSRSRTKKNAKAMANLLLDDLKKHRHPGMAATGHTAESN